MSGPPHVPMPFNRVLRRFRDDLTRPEYAEANARLADLVERMGERGIAPRLDFGRDWENAHVLVELERLSCESEIGQILDVGGGGSPLAYLLAESGHEVVVADLDREVAERVRAGAEAMGLGDRLSGVPIGIRDWRLEAGSFDCVLSVSVFEGILRKHREPHFAALARTMAPGASLLMTFDYGEGARLVGDPPVCVADIERQIVGPSGLELVGELPSEPVFEAEHGPPVKAVVPTVDGYDWRVAEYSFAALHLRKPE